MSQETGELYQLGYLRLQLTEKSCMKETLRCLKSHILRSPEGGQTLVWYIKALSLLLCGSLFSALLRLRTSPSGLQYDDGNRSERQNKDTFPRSLSRFMSCTCAYTDQSLARRTTKTNILDQLGATSFLSASSSRLIPGQNLGFVRKRKRIGLHMVGEPSTVSVSIVISHYT